ncbi:GntR family transcriptional regulator [Plantactinospora sp. KLBMP9567]|uniref:GntR family transcriptional regulator n=1 Tax=Plantactinospora sp. KLBMP9567 TaxID=3085900 RepID=UPI0029818BB9|nr:GntR family transcriptional regulator [Plantactinospora sp. KLBMP9567]MDW5325131.1 GntR family transcriptional regulator [Plantactinospora sp. KLBMP9567]MDW5329332.1 GntR family transcriptional regulator [Plantactinospora sp. KLBMP9567]
MTWLAKLQDDRSLITRASTAQRVAEILRARITEGALLPGTRLSEEMIGAALGVSRNTLRESFRLLMHERLVVHELNRGVFVRVLDVQDVVDIYRVRRVLECAAVSNAGNSSAEAMDALEAALVEGEQAAAQQRWFDVGTANMQFHQAIAGLTGSPRIEEIMRQALAEIRLAFHVMAAPQTFHQPYLERHRELLELIRRGEVDRAHAVLDDYLRTAERQLVDAYADGVPESVAARR